MSAVSCMGGWCAIRTECPLYGRRTGEVMERLCRRGEDGEALDAMDFPVRIHRATGQWEHHRDVSARAVPSVFAMGGAA